MGNYLYKDPPSLFLREIYLLSNYFILVNVYISSHFCPYYKWSKNKILPWWFIFSIFALFRSEIPGWTSVLRVYKCRPFELFYIFLIVQELGWSGTCERSFNHSFPKIKANSALPKTQKRSPTPVPVEILPSRIQLFSFIGPWCAHISK